MKNDCELKLGINIPKIENVISKCQIDIVDKLKFQMNTYQQELNKRIDKILNIYGIDTKLPFDILKDELDKKGINLVKQITESNKEIYKFYKHGCLLAEFYTIQEIKDDILNFCISEVIFY